MRSLPRGAIQTFVGGVFAGFEPSLGMGAQPKAPASCLSEKKHNNKHSGLVVWQGEGGWPSRPRYLCPNSCACNGYGKNGCELPCKPSDRLLFNASTIVTIGNGAKAQFWHNSWLDGEAPRNLAPHLFQLVKRKNRSVQQELQNNKWIRSLQGKITTATQVEEFVSGEFRTSIYSQTCKIPSLENGPPMVYTPPSQHTASSSKGVLGNSGQN